VHAYSSVYMSLWSFTLHTLLELYIKDLTQCCPCAYIAPLHNAESLHKV